MIHPGLTNRVVIITGANNPHGIGAAIARAFARQDARLFLHGYRAPDGNTSRVDESQPGEGFYLAQNRKSLDETLQSVRDLGGQVEGWEVDLEDPQAAIELMDRAEAAFGSVEVLVNNAAYWEGDTFLPTSESLRNALVELWTDRPQILNAPTFERIFAVDTRAPALLMVEFARRHIARGANWGRIINISTAGAYVFPSEVTYGASKLALEGYTRSAAVELGRYGITANVLSLGPIQTGWITPELEKEILPTIPLGRLGQPEDVADVAVFLASDQARWLTGQTIYAGGGHGM
jgi:3-oxoacyl-[acyl-carrier protein] reductase